MHRFAFAARVLALLLVFVSTFDSRAATEPAGSMAAARQNFAAVTLADGRVLVAGGYGAVGLLASTEIYDRATNTFSAAGPLITKRGAPAAARLPDGRVLIVGGAGPGDATAGTLPLAAAEIFDPATNAWSNAGAMAYPRRVPVALALIDGRILVMGGGGGDSTTTACEIYDPATGTFASTGSFNQGREAFTAAVLPDGRVLVLGGVAASSGLASAELWDPASGAWSAVGAMAQARVAATATVLADGRVLVSGGQTGYSTGVFPAAAELFDPAAGTFAATGALVQPRSEHRAMAMADGRVMIAGGINGGYATAIEVYDPATSAWSAVGSLTETRRKHAGAALPGGAMLVAGGYNATASYLASAEILDVACLSSTPTLSGSSANYPSTGGSGSVDITQVAGCSWRASGAPSWVALTSPAKGTGNGTLTYDVSANPGTARGATFTIAQNAYTVSQDADPCTTATLSPSTLSFTNAGGDNAVTVAIPASCAWTVGTVPSWLVASASSGTGGATLTFTATANGGAARSATVTVAGKSLSVSQAAGACSPAPTLSPSSASYGYGGGSGSLAVTAPASCAWSIANAPSWITFNTNGTTGNQTITYSVAANPDGTSRSAAVTVAGATFSVTQTANTCAGASISPSSVALPNTNASGTLALSAPAGCSWSVSGVPSWISLNAYSGSGSATLTYSALSNSTAARSAVLGLAGTSVTFTQAQGACYPASTISPTSAPQFVAAGGSFTVNVSAQSSCGWTVSNLPAWIVATSPLPGTGSGTVTYSVAANSGAARSATIVIAGSTHYVSQSAGACATAAITPASASLAAPGGSATVNVSAAADCTWTVTGMPAWISITSALPVTGSGSVSYAVASNTGTARSATLVVAGLNHAVSQSGTTAAVCSSKGTTSYEYIQSVTFGGVTRASGNNGGYADFTSPPFTLVRGSNSFTLVPGFPSGAYGENWRVWIDYNNDNVFSDSELVWGGASSGSIFASFVIPSTASGTVRMRVSMRYGTQPLACGSFSYGEVEDYTVTIQ